MSAVTNSTPWRCIPEPNYVTESVPHSQKMENRVSNLKIPNSENDQNLKIPNSENIQNLKIQNSENVTFRQKYLYS